MFSGLIPALTRSVYTRQGSYSLPSLLTHYASNRVIPPTISRSENHGILLSQGYGENKSNQQRCSLHRIRLRKGMIVKNESRRVSPFPCFSLTHRSQFTSLRVAPHDTQSCVLCNQMREHEQVVPWCNWLALRTLNPAIRVQISVGPSFLPSFLFASVNHSLTIATHMRFGVTCVSFFPSMMQTRNPAISTSSLSI